MSQHKGPDWATGKHVFLHKPEEQVRQEYERMLCYDHGYSKSHMDIEVPIQRGSSGRERADLVVYSSPDPEKRDQARDVLGIVELKRRDRDDGLQQLTSYMSATSCKWGVWTNGEGIEFLYKDPASGEVRQNVLFQVPHYGQPIDAIGTHKFDDLRPASNLKLTFRRLLNELYTNTNISRREKLGNEMTKLLFCKLQDEQFSPDQVIPRFRVGLTDHQTGFEAVRQRIDELFIEVKEQLAGEGVFEAYDVIVLENRSVAYVVGELQGYSLTQTDEDAIGSAFEVFAESKFAGEKGEFFTPREIVKTAIRIIDPQPGESIIDPACGSGGFLICALQHIWESMEEHPRWKRLTPVKFTEAKRQIARETIYGLDKESDLVRIAKAYMAIIGDGKSRIAQANSLHGPSDFLGPAKKLLVSGEDFKQFDIVLTNPPFGSKNTKVSLAESSQFDLGHRWSKSKGEYIKTNTARKTPAQELFIERCLDLLKPGGRMAIVLPETYGHAPTKRYIRRYIMKRATIKAVIDLPHNTFRPHCNAKTLLWILEKRKANHSEDIIFGIAEEMGRDHHGKVMYRLKNGEITDEVWNDMPDIREEWADPKSPDNERVLTVPLEDLRDDILVPRHYWNTNEALIETQAEQMGLELISMETLIEEGALEFFTGHGAPPNQYKGTGPIPYVRVGDIGNLMVYKNPTAGIPRSVYLERRKSKILKPRDLVFVRDGSYRIGDVGIIMPSDTEILLDSHCVVLRIVRENRYDIDGLYLAYLLRHDLTQKQLPSRIFINTTLPDIRNRWRTLMLPVSRNKAERERVRHIMQGIYQRRLEAENMVSDLLQQGAL